MSDIPPNTPTTPELPSPEQQPSGTIPPAQAQEAARPGGPGRVWSPSPRLTAVLAAAMLAIGVAVGAAIGPAPTASFAGASELPVLLHSLLSSATASTPATGTTASPSASTETPAPTRRRRRRHASTASAAAETAGTESAGAAEEGGSSTAKTKGSREGATKPLPPITKVWVIELNGSSFEEALSAPASAPYIDKQAVPSGSLLSSWSALSAITFANDAALIATTEPQIAQTIIQPLCPEGAVGAGCSAGTPGAISTADTFLNQALPTITSSAAYRSSGLIIVTFASIAAGASSELPAGSTTATLTTAAPAGALLISPFATKGARPNAAFKPSSPRQSLEALLHR